MGFVKHFASLTILAFLSNALAYVFDPDIDLPPVDPRVPVLYDIAESQTFTLEVAPTVSFVLVSYITTTTGAQFFFFTGMRAFEGTGGYGSMLLDLGSLNRVWTQNLTVFTDEELSSFNYSRPGFDVVGISPDKLSLNAQVQFFNASLDLTMHATSRALYYGGGTGSYMFVDSPAYEWHFPAARTSGTLSLSDPSMQDSSPRDGVGQKMDIDSTSSFSWYVRYWGAMGLRDGNSTGFNLHFDDSGLVLGTYMIDSVDPPFRSRYVELRFRNESAQALVPVDVFEADMEDIWVSPRTGLVYPQRWDLGVEGRGILHVRSVLGDQETNVEGAGTGSSATGYVGFVTFDGWFDGEEVSGFGLVELLFAEPV